MGHSPLPLMKTSFAEWNGNILTRIAGKTKSILSIEVAARKLPRK
jgi:hypothetical protein